MNAITWMVNPPMPAKVGSVRVHRCADDGEIPLGPRRRLSASKTLGCRPPNADVMRAQSKVLKLLRDTRQMMTSGELAKALGMSDRTVRRHIRYLVAIGTPIHAKNGYGYEWKGAGA